MYIEKTSIIAFKGSSSVKFINNYANDDGGVMYGEDNSRFIITFEGNSIISFIDNYVNLKGGVMYIGNFSTITSQGNCIACKLY